MTPATATQGIHLTLNGKPWYFSGTNAFNLAQYDAYEEEVRCNRLHLLTAMHE